MRGRAADIRRGCDRLRSVCWGACTGLRAPGPGKGVHLDQDPTGLSVGFDNRSSQRGRASLPILSLSFFSVFFLFSQGVFVGDCSVAPGCRV